ncbi:MAG: tetratricopeptide repeat protein [Verrucomicrobiota bacterium]
MKNKKLLIIGGGVCLLFTVFSGCGERSGEKEYNKALASWKSGDLVRAQGQFERAIRKLSGNEIKSVANNQLGLVRWSLGKQKRAIESFAESCRLAEDLGAANLNLGIALYHAGQIEQAEFELTKVLNEQPSNAAAQSYMGLIHMQKKDWKSASREISSGLRSNPNDAAAQNALALAELHQNNGSDAAIKRLKQLVSAYPDYAPATYNLAVIYDQWLHNEAAALGWYKQYLQKAGTNGREAEFARQSIARLERKQARGTTSASPQRHTNPELAAQYITRGSKLHSDKKYKEALKQYEKAIQADPSQKAGHYNMGLTYYELKKYSEAAKACSNALKLDPAYADARYMRALSYTRQRKWSDAEREAKALKKLDAKRGKSMLKYISDTRKR